MTALKFATALAAVCAVVRASNHALHGLQPKVGETGSAVTLLSRGPERAVLLNATGAAIVPIGPNDTPTTPQKRPGTWNSHQTTFPNPSTAITVNAQGRYIRVQLSGTRYLRIAEVQVFETWR